MNDSPRLPSPRDLTTPALAEAVTLPGLPVPVDPSKLTDLVGQRVVVTNPLLPAEWVGVAIAYVDAPSFLVQLDDGDKLALPAAWARLAPADDCPDDEQPDDIPELNYGGTPVAEFDVGTDADGRPLYVRQTLEGDFTVWRFSHVCSCPRRRTLRIAPALQIGAGHEVIATDPLHIEASILCSDCGIHGWIRGGTWSPA